MDKLSGKTGHRPPSGRDPAVARAIQKAALGTKPASGRDAMSEFKEMQEELRAKVNATKDAKPEDIPELKKLAAVLHRIGDNAKSNIDRARKAGEGFGEYEDGRRFWRRIATIRYIDELMVLSRIEELGGKSPEITQRIEAARQESLSCASGLAGP